jgi:hypothetical protein
LCLLRAGNICIYCPGGPDSDFEYSTQSYTGYEPTSMRAIRARCARPPARPACLVAQARQARMVPLTGWRAARMQALHPAPAPAVSPTGLATKPKLGGCPIPTCSCPTAAAPAAAAAPRRYNPYVQARSRVDQLRKLGHSVDKVEFILMGGTFMSLPADYRDYFVRNLHDALSGHSSANIRVRGAAAAGAAGRGGLCCSSWLPGPCHLRRRAAPAC